MRFVRLVSVHIPKTAGTTLGSVLRQTYGIRFFHDRETFDDTTYKNKADELWRRARRRLSARICTAIHGHFPASRHYHEEADLITFVRDPIARRVSFWRYVRRQYQHSGVIRNAEWEDALRHDLPDFMGRPDDCYSRFLDIPLARFSFIGTVSDFHADMMRLGRMLGFAYEPQEKNSAPNPFDISDSLRQRYMDANESQMALFTAALARRAQILTAPDR